MSRHTGDDDVSPSERMKSLELKAQVIRSRLLRTVDALDDRRHQAIALGHYAKGMAKPAALSLVTVVVGVGVGAFAIRWAFRARKRRSFSSRASHLFRRLDLVPKQSMSSRIVEKLAVSILTLAATELMNQISKSVAAKADERVRYRALPQAH